MVIEPNWDIFKYNFSENPQKVFEWMCYLLFCKEHKIEKGIPTNENQTAIETLPIQEGNEYIGFQAKFYEVKLSDRTKELKETVLKAKKKYTYLTKIIFYINKNWNDSPTKEKTNAQIEVENCAVKNGILIEWRTDYYFRSPEVAEKYSSIILYFFSKKTNQYYEKIASFQPKKIEVDESKKYETLLQCENTKIINKFSLFEYINSLLIQEELMSFPDIYIKGVAGVSKSVEMKFAYNKILEKCRSSNTYRIYHFLPTPYFFELKDFQDKMFENISDETPFLFLDGLDEISDEKIITLKKQINILKTKIPGSRFIVSGRDAAFINEFIDIKQSKELKLLPYIDSEVQSLMWYYKGTPLESLVSIPFYRNFAESHKEKQLKTYKEFITALIIERLENDKRKFDISNNISARNNKQSSINLEKLKHNFSKFCYTLFKQNKTTFEQSLLYSLNKNEIENEFILKSSLINYKSEHDISFYSNIYFEYFLAYYFSQRSFEEIQKEFFLPNKKINVKYINIISILLNLMDTSTSSYKELTSILEKDNICYILLTDFDKLTAEKRFEWYTKIINDYNSKKKLIYYARFVGSYDLLANIDSLSDKLTDLLPENFQSNAFDMHLSCIKNFLDNPTEEKLREFSNSVILLGVNDRSIWNTTDAQKLKTISIPLIKFFFFHPLAKNVKGILSARFIFNWYGTYNWIDGWTLEDWRQFIKPIYPQTSDDFYLINDFIDHEIKMSLFIYLYKNKYIWKLYVPLSNYMLSNSRNFVPSSTPTSDEIDDDYTVKTFNIGGDDYLLTAIIKQEKIDLDGIIEIFKTFSAKKINLYNLGG